MSEKIRTTVSLHSGIVEKARAMMAEESFSDFSGYLEQLIREKWQARQSELKDAPAPTHAASAVPMPTTYGKKSKARRANN